MATLIGMPKKKPKPGPAADRLVIDADDWEQAVKKAVKVEKPEGGWPKSDPDKKPAKRAKKRQKRG